jgi:hypothetical protein
MTAPRRAIDLAVSGQLKSTYRKASNNQKLAAIEEVFRHINSDWGWQVKHEAAKEAAECALSMKDLDIDAAKRLFRLAATEELFLESLRLPIFARLLEQHPPRTFDNQDLRDYFASIKKQRGVGHQKAFGGLEATRQIDVALNFTIEEQSARPDPILMPETGVETRDITKQLDDWVAAWMSLVREVRAAEGVATDALVAHFRTAEKLATSLPDGHAYHSIMDPRETEELNDFRRFRVLGWEKITTFDEAWLARIRDGHQKWLSLEPQRIWIGSVAPHSKPLTDVNINETQSLCDFLRLLEGAKPNPEWLKSSQQLATGKKGARCRRALIAFLRTLPARGSASLRARVWPDVVQYRNFRSLVLSSSAITGSASTAAVLWFFARGLPWPGYYENGWGGFFPHEADPAFLSESAELIVRGAIWMLANWKDEEVVATLQATAEALLTKLSTDQLSLDFRSLKCANACINVLGEIATVEAIQANGRIKLKVRDGRISNLIVNTMTAAAKRANVSVDDLLEISAPTFGLDDVGQRTISLENHTLNLQVRSTSDVRIITVGSSGNPTKSLPRSLKDSAAGKAALKELGETAKSIRQALPVHRQRIESFFLSNRQWPLSIWRERYLDHPLVGTLTQRLIWCETKDGRMCNSFMWFDGGFVDWHGKRPKLLDRSIVRLWHPLEAKAAEVSAWRSFLRSKSITQPFKQAHREVYPVTDAERDTASYSNRFAGHILRQHQAGAIGRTRGWRVKLCAAENVTESESTHVKMPDFGLAGELWTDRAGGEDAEFVPSGAYVFISTERVRFRRLHQLDNGREALGDVVALTEIPPRIFSEVMRDVDLFVGVASIGNDPTWADRGATAEHPSVWRRTLAQDYWRNYSTAELNVAGENRRQILADLLPSLTIADRCELQDRYLQVRGTLRTYRIHLGSANILMDNDRYLCIVARPNADDKAGSYLPFEGDHMLSVILSKAIMLADDDKISDASILSQLKK